MVHDGVGLIGTLLPDLTNLALRRATEGLPCSTSFQAERATIHGNCEHVTEQRGRLLQLVPVPTCSQTRRNPVTETGIV